MNSFMSTLFQISIFASFMIFVVIMIKSVFAKRMHIGVMAILWMVVLFRLCMPLTIQSPIHLFEVESSPTTKATVSESAVQDNTMTNTIDVESAETVKTSDTANDKDVRAGNDVSPVIGINEIAVLDDNMDINVPAAALINQGISVSVWSILFAFWATGALFMILNATRKIILFNKTLEKCSIVQDRNILEIVGRQLKSLRIKRDIRIFECNQIDVPMIFGYFKPCLLIPKATIQSMHNKDMEYVLTHELCHIKRHDILFNYIWLVAKVIHWFNPLVYLAFKLFQENVEIACDRMVVDEGNHDMRYTYSQILVDVVRVSKNNISLPVTVSFCDNADAIKERITRMIKPHKKSKTAITISCILAVVMIFAGFTTACVPQGINDVSTRILSKERIEKIKDDKEIHQYDVPETWEDEIKNVFRKTDVYINARINTSSVSNSLYEVIPQNVDQEYIDNIITYLIGDNKIYHKNIERTKAEVQEEIEKLSSKLSFNEYGMVNQGDIESLYIEQIEIRKKGLRETIRNPVKFEFNTYVDALGYIAIDKLFEFTESNKPYEEIYTITNNVGEVDLGKATFATIVLDKKHGTFRFENSGAQNLVLRQNPPKPLSDENKGKRPLQDKVVDMYDDFQESIGYNPNSSSRGVYLNVYDGQKLISDECYSFATMHSRYNSYDDFPILLADSELYKIDYEDWVDNCNKNSIWPTIDTYMVADKSGIILAEKLALPSKTHWISRGIELIEFDEVMNIFKKNVYQVGNYEIPDNTSNNTILVDEIVMSRMYVEGGEYEGQVLIIPVWHVFGEVISEFNAQEYLENRDDDEYALHIHRFIYGHQPIMTINAIDGTIIE
ncbi:MAG: M56 family metallopeptidase [Clostridiales bacterium]|nr:M56 family metallopeptidase [Clostridiales bacterium]